MNDQPLHVLITGTTSGLGLGLLEHYYRLGVKVTAVNRRKTPNLEERFPNVHFRHIDVQNRTAIRDLKNLFGFIRNFFNLQS